MISCFHRIRQNYPRSSSCRNHDPQSRWHRWYLSLCCTPGSALWSPIVCMMSHFGQNEEFLDDVYYKLSTSGTGQLSISNFDFHRNPLRQASPIHPSSQPHPNSGHSKDTSTPPIFPAKLNNGCSRNNHRFVEPRNESKHGSALCR
jgi:hypothetical protein